MSCKSPSPHPGPGWERLIDLEEVPVGAGRYVLHGSRALAVFRPAAEPDDVRVIDDTCPHAGASLSAGHLDATLVAPDDASPGRGGGSASSSAGREGTGPPLPAPTLPSTVCVICPWHAWPFHLDSGVCPDNPGIAVRRFEARVVRGVIWAKLGEG